MRLQPITGREGLLTLTAVTCVATTVACGGGAAPELNGLTDHVAQVGTELKIDLNGTDPDGDQLTYRYRAADLPDIGGKAQITVSPSGSGVFRWTPLAQDVGEHAFDFIVSDGSNDTTVTINIDVKSAIGSATSPLFRQPLGTGTTLDLSNRECIDFDVVIEDQDSAQVELALEQPITEGMRLDQEDGLTARFNWCPTKEQENEQRYTVVISANDGENPKAIKNYLIVLRGSSGSNCPGAAPAISHTPADETTVLDLTIGATVTDDKGLKEAPLFYYSLTNPGANPDLGPGGMTQLETLQIDGTPTSGVYAADVPNPVATMPAGTSATIYYVFVADDDDDEMGNCDHSTQSQVYSMTVTSGGASNLGLCEPCSADIQCGAGDLCTYIGSMGESYCLQACGSGCPTGYACSAEDVWSVDWNSARQCVPTNGSCTMPTAACEDDDNEDDDNQTQASANAMADGPMTLNGFIDGVSCPKPVQPASGSKADDDWRQLKITEDTEIDLYLSGGGESDLDLQIYTSSGTLVSKSTTLQAEEQIKKCLRPATYYVKVNGFTNARSEYFLSVESMPKTCNTTCVDDSKEDDDTGPQARATTAPNYSSTGNKICPDDSDWYKVRLTSGQKLTIDLASTASGDLDIHLYDGPFFDMWPCSVEDVSTCDPAHGQSGSSTEHAEYTAPASCGSGGCDYFVVIEGYASASNDNYSLSLKVE
ncbi:MAG: pre-peptidase C-terminal domain-containing protein [Kofleriaceae bacterium]|nr:pre-peptidase C-terminal domain-containing protein [Kofleriaceae bacterium]